MEEPLSPAAASSVLQWWMDAGVDVIVDEEPRDWLRPKPKAAPAPAGAPAPRQDELPGQLELFQAYLRESETLAFASPSAPRVCPSGDPTAGLMMITDMPSTDDCGSGGLLSGETGKLFDRMLAAIGRDRSSIYLASLACFRSPGSTFTGDTASQCATLARHHVGLACPKAVLLFGDTCSKALLGIPMAQARGRWHELQTHAGPVKALVTLHPDFLLRQPSAKAHAWADLQLLIRDLQP